MSFKLTYFPIRGRAELLRLILEASGSNYEYEPLHPSDWGTFKPQTPFGQLPILSTPDIGTIPQSMAIARYLAKKFNFYPTDLKEQVRVEVALEAIRDIADGILQIVADDDFQKLKVSHAKKVEAQLQYLEKFLSENSTASGYVVGDKPTLADLQAFNILDNFVKPLYPEILKGFPGVVALKAKIASIPNIQEYLKSERRPAVTLPGFAKALNTPEECQ
eukprot:TRINITY_DN4953_c0_g1_i2.p1 TRINITY_DN4953_c0_g1~~TRINITY_DN4953_c0_g1_i2.p1  ORF type:complete len:219 (+),score=37.88 TRINITY_DN4953_c0_g1_i2:64-720(+)